MPVDLETYKPESAEALVKDLLGVAGTEAGDAWKKVHDDVTLHLDFIAKMTLRTTDKLAAGTIDANQAAHTLSLLALNLKTALLELEILPHVVAQAIADGVFKVVKAVVRNFTGVNLDL